MNRIVAFTGTFAIAALLGASGGSASPVQQTKLFGAIGGDGITLRDAQGTRVTTLDPGTYDIAVDDQSDFHDFHLQGPGVDESTGVEFIGKVSWTVTFKDGVYDYFCDVHPVSLHGAFTAGTPPPPPPSTGAVTSATKLVLTSGPEQVITLKTSSGKAVKAMKLGTYTVVVRDRGRIHDVHIVAPGFDRKTKPLTYTGTQTWKVKLAKAGTFRFLCDPHALVGMKGSAKLVP